MDTVPDPVTRHCAYVLIGDLSESELIAYTHIVTSQLEREIKLELPAYSGGCVFTVNVPSTKVKNYQPKNGTGHAFVWFTKSEVFFKLIGLAHDGSEIINLDAASASEEGESEHEETLRDVLKRDWSEPMPTQKRYTPPTNPVGFTPIFSRAFADRTESKADGVLFCMSTLPEHISNMHLMKIFMPFCTAGEIKITRTDKGNAYIAFSHTDDAYFALHMRARYYTEDGTELAFALSRFLPPTPRCSGSLLSSSHIDRPWRTGGKTGDSNRPRKKRGNQRW